MRLLWLMALLQESYLEFWNESASMLEMLAFGQNCMGGAHLSTRAGVGHD